MKARAALLALLFPFAAHSAPFLTADAYTFPANIPQSAFAFTAVATPGPFSMTCTVTTARVPRCDAATALAVPISQINFVMTVTRTAGCDANGANCWTAGSAPSVPFVRSLLDPTVGAPTGLFLGQ